MTPADVITVAVCALFSVGVLSLLVKPVMELRAKRRRVPVTVGNRAIRDSYAALLKNADPNEVARLAERRAPELVRALARLGELAQFDRKDVGR